VELVIARSAGTVSSGSEGRDTESSSRNLHSSTGTIAATAGLGLVIEAMRKIVSRFMGAGWPNLIARECVVSDSFDKALGRSSLQDVGECLSLLGEGQ
jgi:hypothetical protein